MIILGIDPGYAIVGYGALRFEHGRYRAIGFGAITTEADMDFPARLQYIYDNMMEMIRKCNPDAVAIEKLYFHTNQKTVIHVAEARGVILLAAQKSGVPIYEYTPLQVKTAVTGYGRAHKPQVMEMTTRLLKLKEVPKPDDTADALAVAVCHAHAAGSQFRYQMLQKKKEG